MTGGNTFSLAQFLYGALIALLWCVVGFSAWWAMFRAPLGRRTFRTRVRIRAPVEKIWSSYLLEASPPGGWGGALEISWQAFQGEPPARHSVLVRHGGAGPFRESVWRILRMTPHVLFESEQESVDGTRLGADDLVMARLRLVPQGETVLVEHEMRRLVRGAFGYLYIPRANRRCFEHLRAHCEGVAARNAAPIVSRSASLLLAIVAFGVMVAVYSAPNPEIWEAVAFVAVFLQVAIWAHEYGHLIAMRWFGQRDATLFLAPLLGGVALSTSRSKSRFEDAMIALMGPAFSGAIVLALTPFVPWGLRYFDVGAGSEPVSYTTWAGLCVIAFLAMAIPINLYNLIPIGMLDGGRVVDALAQGRVVRAICAAGIFAALAYAIAGSGSESDFGAAIAFVAIAWASAFLTARKGREELPPMSRAQAAATVALLVVTLIIHVEASRLLLPSFMNALRGDVRGAASAGPARSEPRLDSALSGPVPKPDQTAAP